MKNKISDLNNHLFAQLERLSDEDLKGEELDREVKRADAIVAISEQIVGAAEHGGVPRGTNALLLGKDEEVGGADSVQ